ncbi:MAG: electron transfer flavoprotein subunit alpha, partial [Victivallales bacterium]|nr:electron transfer flavoprotein subunit alpha [Victivallales bacterium]
GSVQHRAGMAESAKIICINSDAGAPLFAIADYGIVGDLHAVIPKMIKAYKARV